MCFLSRLHLGFYSRYAVAPTLRLKLTAPRITNIEFPFFIATLLQLYIYFSLNNSMKLEIEMAKILCGDG